MKRSPKELNESITCLALIKPASDLARELKLNKPSYCIYEYDSACQPDHQIRWGDGSWQNLGQADLDSLILLPEFDSDSIDTVFEF